MASKRLYEPLAAMDRERLEALRHGRRMAYVLQVLGVAVAGWGLIVLLGVL